VITEGSNTTEPRLMKRFSGVPDSTNATRRPIMGHSHSMVAGGFDEMS
jgi:hypothetical protein